MRKITQSTTNGQDQSRSAGILPHGANAKTQFSRSVGDGVPDIPFIIVLEGLAKIGGEQS